MKEHPRRTGGTPGCDKSIQPAFDQPVAHTLLDVPDCRMSGTFILGDEEWDYLFRLGAPLERTMLQFTPPALRRFLALATDLLAVPPPGWTTPLRELPRVVSPS